MKKNLMIIAMLLGVLAFVSCDNADKGKKETDEEKEQVVESSYEELVFDGTTIQYDETIPKEKIEKIGQYLIDTDFTDGKPKSVRCLIKDEKVYFKMIVEESLYANQDFHKIVMEHGYAIAEQIFDGAKLQVNLCDENFIEQAFIGCE